MEVVAANLSVRAGNVVRGWASELPQNHMTPNVVSHHARCFGKSRFIMNDRLH